MEEISKQQDEMIEETIKFEVYNDPDSDLNEEIEEINTASDINEVTEETNDIP